MAKARGTQCSASGHPAPQREVHAAHCTLCAWSQPVRLPGVLLLHSQVGTTTAELVANFQPTELGGFGVQQVEH